MRNRSPQIKKSARLNSSLSPTPKSLSMNKNSPKKLSKKQIIGQDEIVEKMKKNRIKMCNTLDTYSLLISSNNPIRCLQHNSNISLYCQTQQRLLCSNCIFSTLNHKLHKVMSVEKSIPKISRDIQLMQRHVQRQIHQFQKDYRKFQTHFKEQQEYAHDFLKQVQNFYEKARILLSECQIQSKKRILVQLQHKSIVYQTFLSQLSYLKELYKQNYLKVSSLKDQSFLLYNHITNYSLVNKVKFPHSNWNTQYHEMHKLGSQQAKKVSFLIQVMQKILGQYYTKK